MKKLTKGDVTVSIFSADTEHPFTIKIRDNSEIYFTAEEAEFIVSSLQELLDEVTSNPPPDSL